MKMLIVEDDPVSRLLVQKIISEAGHAITEASDGETAWRLFQEQAPDMVVSDWMMPGMNGLELCRKIRSSGKKTYSYIILLTARDSMKDLMAVFDAGADDYINKPFKTDELKSRIKTGERIIHLERRHYQLQEEMRHQNDVLDATLTELKTTQSRILQADKMASIGQLSAGIAHEINNPIGFIGSNLDALKNYMQDIDTLLNLYQKLQSLMSTKEIKDKDRLMAEQLSAIREFEKQIEIEYLKTDIPELISDCRSGANRIGKIVADLKNFAHPGNDQKRLVDVNKGIQSTLNVIYNEIKYKADIIEEFGEIPMVEGFPQQLNQVFMNILLNAAQAIDKKGVIKIRTQKEQNTVVIFISDTGCGIAKEHLPRIFDPFFTTKEVGEGTGLGMNIAYNIVQAHKGDIHVQSVVDKGTTFRIRLPAAAQGYSTGERTGDNR